MNDTWLGIAGRVVAITGANGGIGRATVRALLENGAHVAMLDRQVLSPGEVAELRANAKGECLSLACDIANDDQVAATAEIVTRQLGNCVLHWSIMRRFPYRGILMRLILQTGSARLTLI